LKGLTNFLVLITVLGTSLTLTLLFARVPLIGGLQLLWEGSFGSQFGLSRTVVKATPLLLTALGMVIAWRARMFNIGGEGQLLMGALLGSVIVKLFLHSAIPPVIAPAMVLAISAIGGGIWAWLPAWLFVRRGVDVVISTILLNFVAVQVLTWAVRGPLQQESKSQPLTDLVPNNFLLPRFNPQSDIHVGSVLAVGMAIILAWYLFRTKGGYLLRLVGQNDRVARANRIDPAKVQVRAMLISGGLCGLAGGVDYLGVAHQLGESFSLNWGLLAIPVSLMGGLHPIGTIASAGYFGALFAGSENLARFTNAGSTLVYIIQAVAVLGLVAVRALQENQRKQTVVVQE